MVDKRVGLGIGLMVVGVVLWAYSGVWYVTVSKAISAGFAGSSAYGPSPSSYGPSGILVIVGVVITAIGLAVAIAGNRTRASAS